MMMTACDVSAITKPWPIQQTVAKLVASEFFEQGDIERDELKSEPMPMMDRKKKDDLPKMQVGFIDAICLPIYKLMTEVDANLSPLLDGVTSNRQNWQTLADDVTLNVEDSMSNDFDSNNSSSQLEQKPENNNNNHATESAELLEEPTHHNNNNNNNIKENNIVSETKSPSPHNDNVVVVNVVPSNGSKTSLRDSKKNKTSKTSSKTCCLL
ncbi:cGMP-specific 3, 5 -cyclic phosphodiesterase-like isoform X1 [Paramuricea clavata]|uniref:cGMP-specific 3,5 -cyclic phosphodiesterase-like isoform X1 n=1 Tax=Paramuricea clavata TaxID=317549 RepID=A0A7D9IJP1_PARCT|nr:cGMP-specific 3, 5 -cyclic phosphodiesterase-like isoform X1 [Paramuricea clavata]